MGRDQMDSPASVAHQRLTEFLEELAEQGRTQAQVAAAAQLQPQYLSDIKRNQRPMTELVARRLEDAFGVSHAWLLGTSNVREVGSYSPGDAFGGGDRLPVFNDPIEGNPHANSAWDGIDREVAGLPAAKLSYLSHPYLLRFGNDDVEGRLRRNDLILISQSFAEDAEIHVVRFRRKLRLARRHPQEGWSRVANGAQLPADCPSVGHAVGIVWGALI